MDRGINEFMMDFQRSKASGCSILTKWKKHFCQLLNVHRVKKVRHTEMHVAEPLIPCAFAVEIAIEELESYKLPSTDQISAEIIQGRGE